MKIPTPARSLVRQAVTQVAIRIAVIVAIATLISYFHVHLSLQAQALEQLSKYIEQRGVRESTIFLLAHDNLRTFAEAYARRLDRLGDLDPAARFAEIFEAREDGTTRVREQFFHSHGITGVIGQQIGIDASLRRRLVLAFEMLAQYGPAWQNRFVNLYVITPESAVLVYWPDKPWGLNANSWEVNAKLALNMPGDEVVLVIDDRERAERRPTWSKLYFDYAVNSWMLSATEPVNLHGRNLISVGHDMLLQELIERTINNRLEGTYNLIFRDGGHLIAHPRLMDAIRARSGDLSIQETGDAHLRHIFELVRRSPEATILDNGEDGEYLAVARLQGPEWVLVTVFPEAIIAGRALETARLILILGMAALLLEIAISYLVLRKQVAEPLNSLVEAANRVATGDFNFRLDERRHDEIGQLARSFNLMSRELKAREGTLNERSTHLAVLNEQLERELKERERTEQEIARHREALHQSEKLNALGSLLAGVAHELNNPLSVVVARAILLEQRLKGTTQADNVAKIRTAAERCARIVKTFLAMARQQKPAYQPVALGRVVEAALELVGYGLRADGVAVAIDLGDGLPTLHADPDQLTQVFTNLFLNAQQAMAEHAGPRRLRISAQADRAAQRVRVWVSDSGPGIPEEIASRVFEPFFTTKAVGKGTGIGLSVCLGILQAHGGGIGLAASELGGATFELALPIDTTTSAVAPPEPAAMEAQTDGHAILIVDDEPEVVELLEEILADAGYRVETAGNGRAALDKLARQPFDLIVSDLRMPDMDGRALYAELETGWPALRERLIFVTGDTLSESAKAFLQTAGRPVIEKPFLPEEVRRAVARELEQGTGPA